MRVVFLGTPEPAVASLRALLDAGHEVPLVVTRPDRPVGRSRTPVAPPIKRLALERGIEVHQPLRVRDAAFVERLRSHDPDVLVVTAYGRILPPSVLELAPHGAINVHFSLLPAYRGAAPVQWALVRGETVTGVTTMQMSEGLDEGDILLRRRLAVLDGEHAPSLEQRLAIVGARLLAETLELAAAGRLEPRPQDHGAATFARPLTAADGQVEPELPAREIEGRVRGFDPWPGAWLRRAGRRMRLLQARAVDGPPTSEPPGTVIEHAEDGLHMACGSGTRLVIGRLQVEGGRPLSARDAVNGRQIGAGDRLEAIRRPG